MESNDLTNSNETSSSFIVCVKTINNETHNIRIESEMLVSTFKLLVEEATTVEPDRQRLIYRGRVLNDDDNIGLYNIEDGQTVHMVAKPVNYRELQRQASGGSATSGANSNMSSRSTSESVPGNINPSNSAQPIFAGIPASSIFQIPSTTTAGGATFQQPTGDMRRAILESMGRSISGGTATTATAIPLSSLGIPGLNLSNNSSVAGQQVGNRSQPGAQLENIRQGMLTVNTLLSMNADFVQEHLPEYAASSEESDLPPMRRFYAGQWIDVKDTVQQWLEATVMNVDNQRRMVFVHYNGWPQRWDEWIRWDSPRIAPFRSRTTHSVLTGTSCPTPNFLPPHANRTGIADIRTIIPEVVQLYQSLQPMMTALAESVTDDLQHRPIVPTTAADNIAEGMPWHRYLQALPPRELPIISGDASPTTPATSGTAVTADSSSTVTEEDSQDHLRQQYRNMIPLLDRFGRVLTDFSSLLWSEVDTYRPSPPANNLFAGLGNQFSANSFEARLLNLLRERPPSPPPTRAYQSPIHGIFRADDAIGAGGLGRSGADHHIDVHIAILSPQTAGGVAVPASTGATNATVASSTDARSAVPSANTSRANTLSTTDSTGGLSTRAGSVSVTGGAPTPESLTRSVADLTSSLQQQAQQLARRTQELTERTSAVSEITQTIGEILRTRREQLENLQQQQPSQAVTETPLIATNDETVDQVVEEEERAELHTGFSDSSGSRSTRSSSYSGNEESDHGEDEAGDDSGHGSDQSDDERATRQYLQDLLLREYVHGSGAEIDILAENERLVDIEMDLLQPNIAVSSQQNRNARPHIYHSHHASSYFNEPIEVSSLTQQQHVENSDEEDFFVEEVDDAEVAAAIEKIMATAEDCDTNSSENNKNNEAAEEDDLSSGESLLADLDQGLSFAIEHVVSSGTSLMPVPVDAMQEKGAERLIPEQSVSDFTHHGHPYPASSVGQVSAVVTNEPDQVPYFNLPNSRLVDEEAEDGNDEEERGQGEQRPQEVVALSLAALAADGDVRTGPEPTVTRYEENTGQKNTDCITLDALAHEEIDSDNASNDANSYHGAVNPIENTMTFVPHDELVETEDFVEERGVPQQQQEEQEEQHNSPIIETSTTSECIDTALDATRQQESASTRRGSGIAMFQRLFSFR